MITCKRRYKGLISPFINEYNVWDIPESEWTPAVQDAVKNAYNMGIKQAEDRFRKSLTHMRSELEIPLLSDWTEDVSSNNND